MFRIRCNIQHNRRWVNVRRDQRPTRFNGNWETSTIFERFGFVACLELNSLCKFDPFRNFSGLLFAFLSLRNPFLNNYRLCRAEQLVHCGRQVTSGPLLVCLLQTLFPLKIVYFFGVLVFVVLSGWMCACVNQLSCCTMVIVILLFCSFVPTTKMLNFSLTKPTNFIAYRDINGKISSK